MPRPRFSGEITIPQRNLMNKHITAALAAAFFSSLTSIGAAAPTAPSPHPAMGREADASQVTDVAQVTTPKPLPTPDLCGIGRTFHPDYSHARTLEQMNAAWDAEIDRVFETLLTDDGFTPTSLSFCGSSKRSKFGRFYWKTSPNLRNGQGWGPIIGRSKSPAWL
jgi:hypothetical protein